MSLELDLSRVLGVVRLEWRLLGVELSYNKNILI
jgi:hypothetical protein